MNKKIWSNWINDWHWILYVSKENNWFYKDIEITNELNLDDVSKLEKETNLKYPIEFIKVLTEYASSVKFGWQMRDEDEHPEFQICYGCGGVSDYKQNPYLWDFKQLKDITNNYNNWKLDCYNDPNDPYGKHFYNKTPFKEVQDGDFLVFDNNNGNIIYISSNEGPLHGHKLADDFIEFISLWSNLGCIGADSEDLSVFYDFKAQKLMKNNSKIDSWKKWLNS